MKDNKFDFRDEDDTGELMGMENKGYNSFYTLCNSFYKVTRHKGEEYYEIATYLHTVVSIKITRAH